jgi:hypothetical protein
MYPPLRIDLLANSLELDDRPTENRGFYLQLKKMLDMNGYIENPHLNSLQDALRDLLVNNLVLDRTGYAAGEGDYESYFLCANVEEEEMPWDKGEVDW